MRTLTVALALVVATLTLTTQIAAACGGSYGTRKRPTVMLISTHSQPTLRSFALMSPIEVGDSAWERLFPHSFDPTQITSLGELDTPMTLTLVGPTRTRVVQANRRVGLANADFRMGTRMSALEIPRSRKDDFVLAVRGEAPGAQFVMPEYRMDGTVVLAEGLTAVHRMVGDDRGFELQRGSRSLGTHVGTVFGILTVDGERYVVADRDGVATTIAL